MKPATPSPELHAWVQRVHRQLVHTCTVFLASPLVVEDLGDEAAARLRILAAQEDGFPRFGWELCEALLPCARCERFDPDLYLQLLDAVDGFLLARRGCAPAATEPERMFLLSRSLDLLVDIAQVLLHSERARSIACGRTA